MAKLTKVITDMWPDAKSWPDGIGPMPTAENVADAHVWCLRAGTAELAANAMHMRTIGATVHEAAHAATALMGATCLTQRNKRDAGIRRGVYVDLDANSKLGYAKRGGSIVMRIALASKVKAAKPVKVKVKAETVEPVVIEPVIE